MKHVYERNDIEVSEELAAKCEKIAEERGKLAGEVSEILESLGDLDEQQQLQVQLQSKQLVSFICFQFTFIDYIIFSIHWKK